MSFTLTATFATLTELRNAAAAIETVIAAGKADAKTAEKAATAAVQKAKDTPPATPPAPVAEKAPAPAPQPPAPPAQAPAPAAAAQDKVDYPTLQKAVFALAGKSRDAATAVAQALGVATFKELPAERYAEALKAVQAKTTELEVA